MAYPKRLLQADEDLTLDLQPHWWFFAKQIGASIPLIAIIVGLLTLNKSTGKSFGLYAWAVLTFAWAVWVAIKYFDWRFTHFVLTNERVIFRTGVLAKRGVEIPLGRINNINFHQGIWERMIGAGDLEIESAGRDGQSEFSNVQHPDSVQQEIYRMMEEFDKRRASWAHTPTPPQGQPVGTDANRTPTGAPANATSVPDQIAQLAVLRDQGALTQAEFDAKKQELLKRM